MFRNKRWKLILSSALILLPSFVGVLLWEQLPQQMPSHWGLDGTVDGWNDRAFVVFGMPAMLLVLHWICIWVTRKDQKNKNQNQKVVDLVLWIVPLVMLFVSGMTYMTVFGGDRVNTLTLVFAFTGILFVIVGNYLPKCRQNHTIGIKIKWTLENEENWNATHRMAGKLWVVGGLLFLACAFVPTKVLPAAMSVILLLLVAAPLLFSWQYAKKHG